jgi:hypothetical protein
MPVTKIQFHPPRDFEVQSVTVKDGIVDVVPVQLGRNTYTTIGHVVVSMTGNISRTSKIEVNPQNGEIRITRLARPGEKEAVRASTTPADAANPAALRPAGTGTAPPAPVRPDAPVDRAVPAAPVSVPAAPPPPSKPVADVPRMGAKA